MKAALVERFNNVIQEGSRESVKTDTDSGAYRQLFEGSWEIWEVCFLNILLFLIIGGITFLYAVRNEPVEKEKLRLEVDTLE